jgi:hypothetical protein
MFTLLYVLARRRRPVRLLKCPDRASLLRPGGLRRASRQPTAGAGTGFRRLSGRRHITPSGDWASGNPTFTLSCGSPGTPPHTPGHVLPVFWHAIFPYCPFGLRSAIRSRDISSHPCPLSGRYNSAPHGAPTLAGCDAVADVMAGRANAWSTRTIARGFTRPGPISATRLGM